MAASSSVRVSTGSLSFSAGCDSNVVPTLASPINPDGLKPNQIAWAVNCTMRGGGISPRRGWKLLQRIRADGLFQEAAMYQPDFQFPYIMAQISGHTYVVRVDLPDVPVTDVTIPGDPDSATEPLNWMCQGEQFMVIQDGVNLPLFWDGVTMRRSLGPAVSYGVLAVAFNAPAIGAIISITLDNPYTGPAGQIFFIEEKQYQQVNPDSIATIKNDWNASAGTVRPTPGTLIPAGTQFFAHLASPPTIPSFYTKVDYITPAYAATIDVPVVIQTQHLGFNYFTSPNPSVQYVQNVTSYGYPPLGPNQIYVVNLNDTPATVHAIGSVLDSLPELPAATAMDYYMGRIWLANGREYIAGDIVGSPATPTSGSPQYDFRDSILHMTENQYISLGGTFIVPTNAGNIRALSHPANLDTALGEGQLLAMTRKNIYSVNVVPQRAAWAVLSEPIQRVAQINFGTTGHRSVVQVNGDLFYQSVDGVRSLTQAIRYFNQWGNVPSSSEEARAIDLNNRALLLYGSGVEFDQRLLQTCLPEQSDRGVIHKGLMPLDFNLLNSIGEKGNPVWEGILQGLNFLQVLQGDFGGLQRCFGIVESDIDKAIEVWELTSTEIFDTNRSGEARITWSFETPSYTWGTEFKLKQLETIELWVDKVYGTVDFMVEFRPDQHPCWEYWHAWQICAPHNECELPNAPTPCNYPQQPYKPQYKAMMTLPTPPTTCESGNGCPMNQAYGFQFRITIKGQCRVRGLVAHAILRDVEPFKNIVC